MFTTLYSTKIFAAVKQPNFKSSTLYSTKIFAVVRQPNFKDSSTIIQTQTIDVFRWCTINYSTAFCIYNLFNLNHTSIVLSRECSIFPLNDLPWTCRINGKMPSATLAYLYCPLVRRAEVIGIPYTVRNLAVEVS